MKKPKTNADAIRLMRCDALAMALMCPNEAGIAEIPCDPAAPHDCYRCLLAWLKQPYQG